MASKYVNVDRDSPMLLPVDLKEWVGRDELVQFIIEAVELTDLRQAASNERGTGSAQYPPAMMLALLISSYARGLFSSRQIERSTYDSVAARFICANTHPDHDTIAKFRRDNGPLLQSCFVRVLELARELKLLKVGVISVDGTKLKANAAKRRTYDRAQLEAEVQRCLQQAEDTDKRPEDEAGRLPPQLTDKAKRLAQLRQAQKKLDDRDRDNKGGGASRGCGRVNTTDSESQIMPTRQGPFIQGYNAQIATNAEGPTLIVAVNVCTHTQDQNQLQPMVESVAPQLGQVDCVLADSGYYNHKQLEPLAQQGIEVYCPPPKNSGLPEAKAQRSRWRARRLAFLQAHRHRMQSPQAKERYRRRSPSTEPVFHTLKNILGFVRFRLRGLAKVKTEWTLIALAYNCRKLAAVL